jgi:RNA polymerase sigma-70 factor, ECF subfamily
MTDQTIAELYDRFRSPLKNFIAKRVSDPATVEDLLHDVFVRIHTNIATLKDSDKVTAWIYQTARNSVIDFYRKRKEPAHEVTEDLLLLDQEEISMAAERLIPVVRRMIEQLPEKYKRVLIQSDFDGQRHADIAADLKMSVSGVKSRVQRARQMLKTLLLECCHFEFDRYGTVFGMKARNCQKCCDNKESESSCT